MGAYPLGEMGVGSISSTRLNDLGRPVGVNHHHAVVIQQSPALAPFERVEAADIRAGLCRPPRAVSRLVQHA